MLTLQGIAVNLVAVAMTSANPVCDAQIDVTAEICPMTYVRTRLALDGLLPGQHLRVTLRGADALRNVPQAARMQGHCIVAETVLDEELLSCIVIQKR